MNPLLFLAVFATPVSVGAVMGWVSWWLPRHRLDRLFAERHRARLAATHTEVLR